MYVQTNNICVLYIYRHDHRCMVHKMQKIKLFGKTLTIPSPFRKSDWSESYKIKLPKKAKLATLNITVDQFVNELEEYYNDTYFNGAFNVSTYATCTVKRGYIFMKVNYNGHF